MPTIACFAATAHHYVRQVLLGLGQYTLSSKRWQLQTTDHHQQDIAEIDHLMRNPDVVGACLFGSESEFIHRCMQYGKPVLNFFRQTNQQPFAEVLPDHKQGGRLAAEHLLATGIRQFVCMGAGTGLYGKLRADGFCEYLQGLDLSVERFTDHPTAASFARIETEKPFGALCINDRYARYLATS